MESTTYGAGTLQLYRNLEMQARQHRNSHKVNYIYILTNAGMPSSPAAARALFLSATQNTREQCGGKHADRSRQEPAVVLWNMAGKPEPASQQTYTDVQDEEVLKAVRWAVENGLVTPETESTLGADVRVNRLQVIGAMYQTNKRKK